MHNQVYIARCALREISGKCPPEVEQELALFVSRLRDVDDKNNKFGRKSEWEADRNEIFFFFERTYKDNGLQRIIPWEELENLAASESQFDHLPFEKQIIDYLRRNVDFVNSQLRAHDANDIMYVPLHAMFVSYGTMKAGKTRPKRSRNTRLVERIANRRDPILIVRGLPGTGKSVAMRQVIHKLCIVSTGLKQSIVPIFIPLGQIGNIKTASLQDKDWVLNEVRAYLSGDNFEDREFKFMNRFVAKNLNQLLEKGRCIIVFDGMDELPKKNYDEKCRALLNFARQWTMGKTNRFIFSCREFDYPKELQIDSLILFPFDWKDVEKYLETHLPGVVLQQRKDEAKKAWDEDGPTRALLDNPFFLHLATRYIQEYPNEKLPLNRGLLFNTYVKRIFRTDTKNNLDADQPDGEFIKILEDLALWISDRKISGTTAFWSDLEQDPQGQVIRASLRNYFEERSLPYFVATSTEGITFRHHRLREFFAALALKRKIFNSN